MKKLLVLLAAVTMMVGNVSAQNLEKNIFGAHVGLNFANIKYQGTSPDSKVGLRLGGSYQRLLASFPLYLETGLELTWKGCEIKDDGFTNKVNAAYLEIPIMVNYKFNIKDKVTLYPSAGFYYALGIGGKIKDGGPKVDTFDYMSRSDFGIRLGANALWKNFTFGLGYEFALTDSNDFIDDHFAPEVKTNNFFLQVGYKF